MTPGEIKESITITDAAPLITASKADRGSVVENKFLMSIPLNVRNPYLLLANVPGVTMDRLAGDNTASLPAKINNPQLVDGALYLNPAAFSREPQFTFGNAARNLSDVRVPGTKNWDLLIEKRLGLDFRTELFNAFNNVVFGGPQTNVTSADFGRIRLLQANLPRQIQFGLRLSY